MALNDFLKKWNNPNKWAKPAQADKSLIDLQNEVSQKMGISFPETPQSEEEIVQKAAAAIQARNPKTFGEAISNVFENNMPVAPRAPIKTFEQKKSAPEPLRKEALSFQFSQSPFGINLAKKIQSGQKLTSGELNTARMFGLIQSADNTGNRVINDIKAGFGDVLSSLGGAVQFLGAENIGKTMQERGEATSAIWGQSTSNLGDDIIRALPFTLSLAPVMLAGGTTGAAVGARAGLGKFGSAVVGAIAGSAASRPLESLMEAGSAYNDARARGMSVEESEKAADNVFRNNMKLGIMDIAELGTAFVPAPSNIKNAALRTIFTGGGKTGSIARFLARMGLTGAQEGLEEGIQENIQRSAMGEPVSWTDPQVKRAMEIGAVFGAGMGTAGAAYRAIKDSALARLSPEAQQTYNTVIEHYKSTGMTQDQAEVKALNGLANTDEGTKIIQQAVPEAINNFNQGVISSALELDLLGKMEQPVQFDQPIQPEYQEPLSLQKPDLIESPVMGANEAGKVIIPTENQIFSNMEATQSGSQLKTPANIDVTADKKYNILNEENYIAQNTSQGGDINVTGIQGRDAAANEEALSRLEQRISPRIAGSIPEGTRVYQPVADEKKAKDVRVAEQIADLFDQKFVYFSVNPELKKTSKEAYDVANSMNGANVDGVIAINADRTNPAHAVTGHEIVHEIAKDKDIFDPFIAELKQMVSEEGHAAVRGIMDIYKEGGVEISESQAWEEFAGDFVGEQMTKKSFWERLAQKAPRAVKKAIEVIKKTIAGLRKRVSKDSSVGQFIADLEKAQELAVNVTARYLEDKATASAEASGVLTETDKYEYDTGRESQIRFQIKEGAKVTDAPEFKKWFGNSKVTDKNGDPLVVYHGGTVDNVFSNNTNMYWFASNKKYADYFAGKEGDTKAVYLSIQNPLDVKLLGNKEYPLDFWRNKLLKLGIDMSEVRLADWAPDYGKYYFYDLFPHAGNNYKSAVGLVDAIKKSGYDGLIMPEELNEGIKSGKVFVAFSPAQIKSVDNQGTFDGENPDIRFQLKADPFYSKLQRTIEAKMPEKTTAAQVLAIVDNPQNVKPEEVKWSGIRQWLQGKGKVTKDEVLGFLHGNQLRIEEVERGGTYKYTPEQSKRLDELTAKQTEITERVIELYKSEFNEEMPFYVIASDNRRAMFGQFKGRGFSDKGREILGKLRDEFDDSENEIDEIVSKGREKSETKFFQYVLPGGEKYRELLFTLPGKTPVEQKQTFRSVHWDEPNVLAHTRFNERTTPDGEKVLFVEEIQSDWHQAGRDKGYYDDRELPAGWRLRETDTHWIVDSDKYGEEKIKVSKEIKDAKKFAIKRAQEMAGTVPDAPFRKTWHEFVLKRLIRLAAENDFDYMAWATGEQQAERYNLRKQIDFLSWEPPVHAYTKGSVSRDGKGTLYAEKNKKKVIKVNISEDELPNYIGKEATRKLLSQPTENGGKTLSGIDLEVGGEGMMDFYNIGGKSSQNIPAFLSKYVKQWGAKIEEIKITLPADEKRYVPEWDEVDGGYGIWDREKKEWAEDSYFDSWEEAKEYINNNFGDFSEQPAIPITPAMKKSALYEGQPLFQLKGHPKLGRWGEAVERGFSKNVRTDINMHPEIRKIFDTDPLLYTQLKNKDTLIKAQAIFSMGYNKSLENWHRNIENFRPEDVPLARMLANEAANKGDYDSARQIITDIAEKLTKAGQFSQAARILRKANPESFIAFIGKQINKLNKQGRKMYGAKWKDIELTDEEIKRINDSRDADEVTREKILEDIGKRIASQMPVSVLEKFDAWRRMAMLTNFKTHIRNVMGNVIMVAMERSADTIGATVEAAMQKAGRIKKEQRTKILGWNRDKDLVEIVNQSWESSKKDLTRIGKYDIENLRFLSHEKPIFKTKWLEWLNQFSKDMLNKGDVPFMRIAYINALGQFMKVRGLTEVTPEAIEYAKRRCLQATFKETNRLANLIHHYKTTGGVGGKLLDAAFPFTTTPLNIVARAVDYSPVGLMRFLFAKGKPPEEVIEMLAKGLTGSAIALLGFLLASWGWARGGDKNSKRAENLIQLSGNRPYSIITPQGSYTFDWAQPFSVPLAMGIAFYENYKKSGKQEKMDIEDIKGAIASGGDTIFTLSVIQGVRNFLGGAYGSPTEAIMGLPVAYIKQALPTIMGQTARTLDNTRRSTYDMDSMGQLKRQVFAMIPFTSKLLEPKLDILGREQKQGNWFQQYFNPGIFTKKSEDPVINEIQRLYDSTKETDIIPKLAPYKFSADKKEYKLTPKEVTVWQRAMGQANYEAFYKVMNTAKYGSMDDEARVEVLQKIVNANYNAVKKAFLDYKGHNKQ